MMYRKKTFYCPCFVFNFLDYTPSYDKPNWIFTLSYFAKDTMFAAIFSTVHSGSKVLEIETNFVNISSFQNHGEIHRLTISQAN